MYPSTQATASESSGIAPVADSGQLLLKYYDSVLFHLDAATTHMESDAAAQAQEPLYLAASLVANMIRALDHPKAPDLCANLESLYLTVVDNLVAAFDTSSAQPIRESRKIMSSLKDAWTQII
jgi:flagellar biosynthetic protein FliS